MYAANFSLPPAPSCMSGPSAGRVEFLEAGAGPLVVLVHSSMAGARQWSALMQELKDDFLVRAVNLFGYGNTPAWPGTKPPSLEDFAELVALMVPSTATDIALVGHSLGGAVAMQAAARQLRGRVKRLVMIEPSLFSLLDHSDHREAFQEITTLAQLTRQRILDDSPDAAARQFIDYWCGPGTWAASSSDKKSLFARLVKLLPHEWNAALGGTMAAAEWAAALPQSTLMMCSAGASRPSREIVEALLLARPDWQFASIGGAGHMAPLTHPQLVNPVVRDFLG